MANYVLSVDLAANIGDLQAKLRQGAQAVSAYGAAVKTTTAGITGHLGAVRKEMQGTLGNADWVNRYEQDLTRAGTAMAVFGGAVIAGLGFAANAAIQWESAWAGVVKTTDATAAQLPGLEDSLRNLTRILPASHVEIAAVAEAAGQLGIKSADVVGFTKVMVNLGEATNLTSDEAATSLAQFMNIMGTATGDVDRLGSALVHLGNNGASTEREIMEMGLRIAGAGTVIGLTEAQVLGFASGLASVGINAEAGGSAISQFMSTIANSVAMGGAELEAFAKVAGVSASEFATAFREKPAEAILMFIDGLGRIQESGGNVFATLSDLGLSGIRMRDMLLRLSSSGDVLAQSLLDGNQAWEENIALVEEAGKRYETTESRIQIAKNALFDAGVSIGNSLLPAIAGAADGLADLVSSISAIPEPILGVIATFGGLVGAAALGGGALLLLIPKIHQTRQAFQTLATQMPHTTRAIGTLGKAVGILAALQMLGAIADAISTAREEAIDFDKVMRDIGSGGTRVGDLLAEWDVALVGWDGRVKDFAATLDEIDNPNFLQKAQMQAKGFIETIGIPLPDGDWDRFQDNLGGLSKALGDAAIVDLPAAQEAFRALQVEMGGTDEATARLLEGMPEYEAALYKVGEANGLALDETGLYKLAIGELSNAQIEAADAAAAAEDATLDAANAAGVSTEAYEAAVEAYQEMLEAWSAASGRFVDANGTYTAMVDEMSAANEEAARKTAEAKGEEGDAWKKYVDDVRVNLDDYIAELQKQEQAQSEWQTNMVRLAGRVSEGTLDYLAQLGPEGALLVQSLIDGTQGQLEEFDRLTQLSMEGAAYGWADTLARSAPLLAAVGGMYGQGMSDAIAEGINSGAFTVEQAATALGWKITETLPGEFIIDYEGNPEGALSTLEALVANARDETGTINLDADARLALEAIVGTVAHAGASTGVVTIDGNPTPVDNTLAQVLSDIGLSAEDVTIDGNPLPADLTLSRFMALVRQSQGDVAIGGNNATGASALRRLVEAIWASEGYVNINANTYDAQARLNAFIRDNNGRRVTVYSQIRTMGQAAVATGGDVTAYARAARGYASGGAVFGPGTGTSDDVPAIGPFNVPFRLSNGEHVWTDAEVKALGGHAAVYALRQAALLGNIRVPGFKTGGGVEPPWRSAGATSGAPRLTVGAGAQSVHYHTRTVNVTNVHPVAEPASVTYNAVAQVDAAIGEL